MVSISTFDDWVDHFNAWREAIGLDPRIHEGYAFEPKYGELATPDIIFGDYKGQKRWEKVTEIPDQRIRDALQHLIVYQGDTEFASVEQQRNLVDNAPSDYDLYSLGRVMCEEMRHGFQMCHVLVTQFGRSGRIEALKQLERRSWQNTRLLGSFNVDVNDWLDFYTYTEFVDRDGKFQLKMLSHSGFAPLARSMGPMLREEAFHLGTGHNGLKRVVKAGVVPVEVLQRYFNKWLPTAYDLFGVDGSSSAHWAYVWGLKGRVDEESNAQAADRERLNEYARGLYKEDVDRHISALNALLPADGPKLFAPDLKFNRSIGDHVGECYTVEGKPVEAGKYPTYLETVLPGEGDRKVLDGVFKRKDWVAPPLVHQGRSSS
ncbi:MAG TPA: Phenylacetic acid catabolic protein [Candidatus Saccharimonadales bacterium]|nr:Phenylacetic acid catabolic protein [Candidatus Saccharimonadales bacterium]